VIPRNHRHCESSTQSRPRLANHSRRWAIFSGVEPILTRKVFAMKKVSRVPRTFMLACTFCLACAFASAQSAAGWYTTAQAASGASAYQKACAGCHGAKLQGSGAPPLVGKQFWLNYGGKKLSTLWSQVHTEMPMSAPDSVSARDSINIMAFLLQKNGVAAGAKPLDDSADLSKVLSQK